MKFFLSPCLKRFSKHQGARVFAGFLASLYIRLVYKTSRWIFEGEEHPNFYWRKNRPFIICFWHGRLLMICKTWKSARPIHMLISGHSDGELIAYTVGHFGVRWIPGSSSKNGLRALRDLIKALRRGDCVGITPDGPRGPCHFVGEGIVRLAKLTGCGVIPVAFSTSRHRIFSSWDRFFLALPLSRGAVVWGAPISPEGEDDDEKLREKISNGLHQATNRADFLCGLKS